MIGSGAERRLSGPRRRSVGHFLWSCSSDGRHKQGLRWPKDLARAPMGIVTVMSSLDRWRALHGRRDLSGVGQQGLPPAMNRWLYRAQERQVKRLMDNLNLRPTHVYEIGAGTGYWVAFWRKAGAEVRGCDFVPDAVERLGKGFELLDITSGRPTGTHELVWIANVLLHIVDDEAFAAALANVAATVRVGGFLVMIEPLQLASFRPVIGDEHSRARTAGAYLEPLVEAGMKLVELRPATALTSDPIEGSSRLRYRAWRALWRSLKGPARIWPALGGTMGLIAFLFDPVVLRVAGGATSKLVVMGRPDPSSDAMLRASIGKLARPDEYNRQSDTRARGAS
jgi:SAM-dependent methyltransferase